MAFEDERTAVDRAHRQDAAATADAADLAAFGYRPQLRRSMGAFSSFAVSFSLISVTTGIFANFGHGLRQLGPAIVWSWTLVLVGQLLVALVLADLAARFPLSGYGYQWTSRLVGPRSGYFVGWLLLLQFVTGFPGVCQALAENLTGVSVLGTRIDLPPSVLTLFVISVIAAVHLFGIRLASVINDVGVITDIVGTLAVTAVLLVLYGMSRPTGLSSLVEVTPAAGLGPAGIGAWASSFLLGAWCLSGFEAAADLAEETHQPRVVVPRAILTSIVTSGTAGFLMLAALVLSIRDLPEVQASAAPVWEILRGQLAEVVTPWVMIVLLVSIFACGLASMAAATRLIYALARDSMLPFSGWLGGVDPVHKIPRAAILSVWGASVLIVVALDQFERLHLVTSISALASYLGYSGILFAALRRQPEARGAGYFSLGKWRTAVGSAAIVWTLGLVAALAYPFGNDSRAYTPALATAAGVGLGVALYAILIRHRIAGGTAGPPACGASPFGD